MASSRPPGGLALGALNKAEWDQPAARRVGLRELHRLHRYGLSFRAPRTLALGTCGDFRLHSLDSLRWFLSHPFFTGIAVLVGERIALEHYATDFRPEHVHSIQSITKTSVHLIAGQLIERGALDPARPVTDYVPEVRGGYGHASLQDALDMAVVNDYSEDFYDPSASVGLLENAHGWRICEGQKHLDIRAFLESITGSRQPDARRQLHYKSANTDVVAWACERAAAASLRSLYLELVEAMGAESSVYLSTDRAGTPFAGGGLHMTLRDLARYGLLCARGGRGIDGASVGSPTFREATLREATRGTPSLLGRGHYRNFLDTNGSWMGHNGYGGQWLMMYPEEAIVIACLSGFADDGGLDWAYIRQLADMGGEIAAFLTR